VCEVYIQVCVCEVYIQVCEVAVVHDVGSCSELVLCVAVVRVVSGDDGGCQDGRVDHRAVPRLH